MSHTNHTVCPFCYHTHELASAVSKAPAPAVEPRMKWGDATLCIACGEMSVMDFTEMLRKPSPDESARLSRDPTVRALREAWRAGDRRRRKHDG
jgi:hypothetical protein